MNRSITRAALLAATAYASLAGSTAFAQDAAAEAVEGDGETIVVTGTRRALSLQDVPINISAVSAEELSEKRIDDVRGIAAFTPGMTILDTGPRSSGTIVLRGLSASDTDTFGNNRDNAVALYLGEVPLYQDFKLLDIERVETLLGPQGTLYGVGTLAGAVRYIPNRPDASKWEGRFHGRMYDVAHAGDPGFTMDATVNIPIVTDKIALRSTVGYFNDPGFIDYVAVIREPGVSIPQPARGLTSRTAAIGTPEQIAANLYTYEDANFEHTFTTRNTLGLFPTEGISIYLNYAFQDTKTNGRQINGAGVFGTGNYEAAQRYLEPSHRQVHLVSGEVQAELGEFAQLVSATAYSKQKVRSSSDVTDLLLDLDYGYELFPQFSGYTRSANDYEQFNQEIRFVSTHGGPFSWVLGGFYNELKTTTNYRELTPGLPEFYFGPITYSASYPEPIEYISYTNSKVTEKAIFGEGSFQVTPEWQVTAGARYFDYDSTAEGAIALPLLEATPAVVFGTPGGGEAGQDGWVWKFNSSYKITPDLMLYGTYSKGYRIGGPNRVGPCPTDLSEIQNACALPSEQFYGPDQTKNKEIGIRATLFDGKLQATVSGYHINWDGIQLASQTQFGAVGITANGGKAVSKGIESTFTIRPVRALTINGSYSYNDAYLTEGVVGLLTVRNQNLRARPKNIRVDVLASDRLPGSARHTGSLGATLNLPLGDGEVSTNITGTYQGEVVSRVGARAGGETIPDYILARASIAYRKDNWELRLYADNLFDKYAYSSVGEDLSRRIINDGVVSRYYTRSVVSPRKVGLEGTVRF